MQGTTKNNLFLTASGSTFRLFENKEKYNEWLEKTKKDGHTMTSFYLIKALISQYHPITQEEFNNELLKN